MKSKKLPLKIKNFLRDFRKEIQSHKLIYVLLLLILAFSAFFRTYRVNALLGFYYDQGRDALKVQEILTFKDFPMVGPTTGIAGLFLGPFWYYFLAIFYLLGRGSPIVAATLLGLLDVGTVFLLYWLGKEFYSRQAGLLAAFFWGFSYYLTRSARWLSNPSPLPFFTVLLLYGLGMFFLKKKERFLILISVCLAISLQLEVASAIFFIPSIVVMWLIFRPKIKDKKNLFWAVGIFVAFLIPQILFEIKNNFLMTKNFFRFNQGEISTSTTKTWAFPTLYSLKQRILSYHNILFSKLETNPNIGSKFLACLWLIFVAVKLARQLTKRDKEEKMNLILITFLFLPLFLLLFFVGNYGQLYDYYLTGFYPAFILLFALFTAFFLRKKLFSGVTSYLYWTVATLIIVWFLSGNIIFLKNYLSAGVDGPTNVTLGNELQAIDHIYKDAGQEKFNVDIYVPPVIPYAYQYLFSWYGGKNYHRQPTTENVPLLYILYEVDQAYPQRLDTWLARQDKIAETMKVDKFGGITVERRLRKNP